MFCTNCGNSVDIESRFCSKCGARVKGNGAAGLNPGSNAQSGEEYYKKGMEHYERGEIRDAFPLFQRAAACGLAAAHHKIAKIYEDGGLGKVDLFEAFKWYSKGAELGFGDSQYNLAYAYMNGEGTEKDMHMALYWMRKAADQGDKDAQYNVGLLYSDTFNDIKNGIEWYKRAAENGSVEAFHNLGLIYLKGQAVEADYQKAKFYLEKSAGDGYPESQAALGIMYLSGMGVSEDPSRGYSLCKQSADQGNPIGHLGLGFYYELFMKDNRTAESMYRKALECSDGDDNIIKLAKNCLGRMQYARGIGKAEYIRTCNICGNRWCSSLSEEERLSNNSFLKFALRRLVYGDSAPIINRLDNERLRSMTKCPRCGSRNYTEDINYF